MYCLQEMVKLLQDNFISVVLTVQVLLLPRTSFTYFQEYFF